MDEETKEQEVNDVLGGKNERLVSALRSYLELPESVVTDAELLKQTKGTLSRCAVEIDIAKKDLAKVAAPVINKIAKDIDNAFSKNRYRH